MIKLVTNIHGVFALRNQAIIIQKLFPPNPKEIAKKILQSRESLISEEEATIKELVETGNTTIKLENPSRLQDTKFEAEFLSDNSPIDVFEFGEKIGVPHEETRKILRKVNIEISSTKLRQIDKDQLIIQAVNSLDEIQESANTLNERLREWYSLHFPELDHLVEGNDLYTKLVAEKGDRKNFTGNLGLDKKHEKQITASLKNTLGVEFSKSELQPIISIAKQTKNLYDLKESIEGYIENHMKDVAPNLTELAGAQLGARLMSIAGSLKRLATMPAGTIQVLGAEDAFFKFLKTGKRPPKHGVIFQYPDIRGAHRNLRGKLSRTLAAKIAIAARADAYDGDFIAPKLKKQFKKRVKDLTK